MVRQTSRMKVSGTPWWKRSLREQMKMRRGFRPGGGGVGGRGGDEALVGLAGAAEAVGVAGGVAVVAARGRGGAAAGGVPRDVGPGDGGGVRHGDRSR